MLRHVTLKDLKEIILSDASALKLLSCQHATALKFTFACQMASALDLIQ
jgi:hypothetical protein